MNLKHTYKYFYQDNLESLRLKTRFLTLDDINTWSEFFKSLEAIELFPAHFLPPGENHAAVWIERQLNRYKDKLYGVQAILDKSTGEFLGQAGLITQEVDEIKELEVGYHMLKKYWGNGYAPEAAKLFLDFAFKHQLNDSVISIINVKNFRSQRVAEKNGLQIDKKTIWREIPVYIYRIWK